MFVFITALGMAVAGARAESVFQSIPFDPFRLECQRHHAVSEMSLRLVTSTESKRDDTLFTIVCQSLDDKFPILDTMDQFAFEVGT